MVILYALLWMYLLLLGFLIYSASKHAWSRLKVGIKILLAPVLVVFGMIDVFFNIVIGSVLFLELPYTMTFSQRCSSHLYRKDWRGSVARAFAVPLNAIDPDHIR